MNSKPVLRPQSIAALFDRAREADPIYHLIALGLLDHISQRTKGRRLTEYAIVDRINRMTRELLKPGELDPLNALFLLQQHVEAKAFYIILHRICRVCEGDMYLLMQMPHIAWPFENPPRGKKRRFQQPSTRQIIREVSDFMRRIGFEGLAEEFDAVHNLKYRHAFSHGSFLFTEQELIFGDYVNDGGQIRLHEESVSIEQFERDFKRFISFRIDAYSVIEHNHSGIYGEKPVEVEVTRHKDGTEYKLKVSISRTSDGLQMQCKENSRLLW